MTQYLLSVHHTDDEAELSDEQTQAMYAATGVFNDEIQASGHWVFAGGLEAPDSATVIDGRGEEPVITDGPFAETKEQIGGFWIVEAADLDEALALARRGSRACGAPVEVRPFQG